MEIVFGTERDVEGWMGLFDLFRKKETALDDGQQKWNMLWELWEDGRAASPFAEIMTYQSEINNGGHDQYFTNLSNRGGLERELAVLAEALQEVHRQNLQRAWEAYRTLVEDDPQAEETLEQCDDLFYAQEADINAALKAHADTLRP